MLEICVIDNSNFRCALIGSSNPIENSTS